MSSKTQNIYAHGLRKDTTVMLMFQPPDSSKLLRDQFPAVWNESVISFRARGHANNSRLAFGYAQTNLVDSAAWVEVKSGDISSLSGEGGKRFEKNSQGSRTKLLICKNNTNARANLSVGFVRGDGIDQRYKPTLVWVGVGAGSNISAQITTTLTPYVTRDYKGVLSILRGEVEADEIWKCNLNELDDVTGWNFIENEESGVFSIENVNIV